MVNIGYNSKASVSRKKLNNAIDKFNIPINHFSNIKTYWKDIEFELREIVKHETTYVGVLRKLNRQPRAGNYKTLQKYITIYNIDVSHFNPNTAPSNKIPLQEILEGMHPTYKSHALKNRLYDADLKKPICECCGITTWNDNPISLELDHINGVSDDHRYDNLRILCPNCHSQTPTFKGRNVKRS